MMLDADGACLSPNSKPHICEHCNAAFRSSYHLRRHVLIHTGKRLSLLVSALPLPSGCPQLRYYGVFFCNYAGNKKKKNTDVRC